MRGPCARQLPGIAVKLLSTTKSCFPSNTHDSSWLTAPFISSQNVKGTLWADALAKFRLSCLHVWSLCLKQVNASVLSDLKLSRSAQVPPNFGELGSDPLQILPHFSPLFVWPSASQLCKIQERGSVGYIVGYHHISYHHPIFRIFQRESSVALMGNPLVYIIKRETWNTKSFPMKKKTEVIFRK